MMLHEAVMLEIYRQALTASELTSPRCQSRESNISAAAIDGRCPSNGSHCSGNERSATPAATTHPSTPPGGLPLPATLPPAAAAALLPPQSAAMAAYFNAAAAAAAQQNHHLFLTNPLAAAASLVQHSTQQQQHQQQPLSPNINRLPTSPQQTTGFIANDEPVLDFSTKGRRQCERESDNDDDDDDDDDDGYDDDDIARADNVKMGNDNGEVGNGAEATVEVNSPLDLSVGRKRDASDEDPQMPMRKTLRTTHNYKTLPPAASNNWVPAINPYLAAVAAASLSPPKSPLSPLEWSGKHKLMPNEATKALEKMTEMTRLGSATECAELPQHRQVNNTSSNGSNGGGSGGGGSGGGRHSAWQSHWLNKGADAVRDVFKCVWCKQSFPTLATLTTHMKETQHCGVNMPPTSGSNNATAQSSGGGGISNQTTQSTTHHHLRHSTNANTPNQLPNASGTTVTATANTMVNTTTTSPNNKSDLNLLIKETMPLPRKLVRGQDVWLGKGAEQTREILKCMWCGQSFRSLAEMTSHMQETQHYTNIISQEQIISWKSTDDKNSNGGNGSNTHHGNANSITGTTTTSISSPMVTSPPLSVLSGAGSTIPSSPCNNSHNNNNIPATVSAVLTCKVCDEAFPTLKELSNHMMKNSHYKEHMMRAAAMGVTGAEHATSPTSPASAASTATSAATRRGRQMREKRKKSLPVRKLLELERAQQDYKNNMEPELKPLRDFGISTKITCEKCGRKVETALFVDHIRQCLSEIMYPGMRLINKPNENVRPNTATTLNTANSFEPFGSPQTPTSQSDGRKTGDSNISHASTRPDVQYTQPKEGEKSSSNSAPSVLNALEQLIEKSFDTRTRNSNSYSSNGCGSQRSTPLGSSILKRLGIDDAIDYTKPLIDPQTMHFMRSYSNYSARDRSASESSSISERCNSRIESFTPERLGTERARHHESTPRLTPPQDGKLIGGAMESQAFDAAANNDINADPNTVCELLNIKTEPLEASNEPEELTTRDNRDSACSSPQKISVKKEFNITDNPDDERQSNDSLNYKPPFEHNYTSSQPPSPSTSERSITPKSATSSNNNTNKQYPATATAAAASCGSSLTALSSMFDNLNNMGTGASSNTHNESLPTGGAAETNNNHTNKKTNANPLAALQKLCDTTEKPTQIAKTTHNSSNGINNNSSQLSGNMMAFSWACNDAVQNTNNESMIKCSQCDAVFSSKGAYRHHFSKIHYIKDDGDALMSNAKSPSIASSPKSAATSPKSATSKSPVSVGSMSAPIINPYSESSQSKFLKYTELAKQLSSKNA